MLYTEPARKLPTREFDVIVAGGGTAGVVAAVAAARQGARHLNDEVYVYGYHDSAPWLQVRDGGTYGVPFRALRVKGLDNLMVAGMMITSDRRPHMSTRNTVSCMAMGQAAGTAAALCVKKDCGTRDLDYTGLKDALIRGGAYFES